MAEKHLTVEELSERLRVPVKTLYKWNSEGSGPRHMRMGRHVRYRLQDVTAWELSRCAPSGTG